MLPAAVWAADCASVDAGESAPCDAALVPASGAGVPASLLGSAAAGELLALGEVAVRDVTVGSVSGAADAVFVAGDSGVDAGDALVDVGTKAEVVATVGTVGAAIAAS